MSRLDRTAKREMAIFEQGNGTTQSEYAITRANRLEKQQVESSRVEEEVRSEM